MNEELRRRGVPAPIATRGRWWARLLPGSDAVIFRAVPFIWASLVAWLLIGVFHLFRGLTTGEWSFLGEYLVVWGALVALAGAENLRN